MHSRGAWECFSVCWHGLQGQQIWGPGTKHRLLQVTEQMANDLLNTMPSLLFQTASYSKSTEVPGSGNYYISYKLNRMLRMPEKKERNDKHYQELSNSANICTHDRRKEWMIFRANQIYYAMQF